MALIYTFMHEKLYQCKKVKKNHGVQIIVKKGGRRRQAGREKDKHEEA
jgi:hypothetical protein